MQDVADRAGIPWSSARNTLKKESAIFVERDGRWYLKNEA